MGLKHYPGAWRFFMCDFNTGFKPPELVKYRPVISVSNRRNDNANLCTIVPISSTRPNVIRDFHYLLPNNELPKHLRGRYPESWVKIDMVTTVCFDRLNLLWVERSDRSRIYNTNRIARVHRLEISQRLTRRINFET